MHIFIYDSIKNHNCMWFEYRILLYVNIRYKKLYYGYVYTQRVMFTQMCRM